ncbi:MAG: DUF4199 domain-containing protein [Cytophagaceae bacterium]
MKISITYGILSGIIISAWIICGLTFQWYETGFAKPWNWLSYIIQVGFLYFGMQEAKVKKYEGQMSYPSALLEGFIITLTLAVIYSLANYLYYYFAGNADIVNYALRESEKYLKEIKRPEEILPNSKVITEAFTPGNQAVSAFKDKLITGIIFITIFAMILRKRGETVNTTK